jgi:hypothetical protein
MESNGRVSQLVSDLEYLKAAIKRNIPVLREISLSANFRILLWYGASALVALSLAFELLIRHYGGFVALPAPVKAGLFLAIATGATVGGFMKWRTFNRVARSIDRKLSAFAIFRTYYSATLLHVYLPLIAIAAAAVVFFALSGRGSLIVGAVALFGGILYNLLATSVNLREYLVCGYWLLLGAVASFLLPSVPSALWVAIIFGGGFFALAIAAEIAVRRRP